MKKNSYTLMHKNFPVAEISISSVSGYIETIGDIHALERMPLGCVITDRYGNVHRNLDFLNRWWVSRSIPASRQGITEVLNRLNLPTTRLLLEKCYGLSLSDHYWVKPTDSPVAWADINFFQNEFTQDMGRLLFGSQLSGKPLDLMSPDNTSDGWLKKKWIIKDGKRMLIKGASGVFQQEPFNEEIATALYRALDINHIPYTVMEEKGEFYSVCENFLTDSTEFIPAWYIEKSSPRPNNISAFEHLLRVSCSLGIPDVGKSLSQLLVTDYILANSDRHVGNFGFIRHVDTLQWLGMAPIFDSGTSLWNDTLQVGRKEKSRPFKSNPDQQLALVTDFSWFDSSKLKDFPNQMETILKKSPQIDDSRRQQIIQAVTERILVIEKLAIRTV